MTNFSSEIWAVINRARKAGRLNDSVTDDGLLEMTLEEVLSTLAESADETDAAKLADAIPRH